MKDAVRDITSPSCEPWTRSHSSIMNWTKHARSNDLLVLGPARFDWCLRTEQEPHLVENARHDFSDLLKLAELWQDVMVSFSIHRWIFDVQCGNLLVRESGVIHGSKRKWGVDCNWVSCQGENRWPSCVVRHKKQLIDQYHLKISWQC